MIFSLRQMDQTDSEWLRCLRNESRDQFFDKQIIQPEQQEQWWRSAAWGDERWVIVQSIVGAPGPQSCRRVGYFSIISPKPDLPVFPTDGRPVRYFSTMIIAPEHRGQGAILAAVPAFDTRSHVYVGYVSEGNHASLRACEKLGFINRGRYKHERYGYIHIVWRDQ